MTVTLSSLRARFVRFLIVFLPLLVGMFDPPRAYASLYLDNGGADPQARLANDADVVALGAVVDKQSAWKNGRILTTVTLKLEGTLKGSARATVSFQVAGGKVGDVAMHVTSAPSFEVGERSMVFLKETQDDARTSTLHLYGGQLGKLPIEQDEAGHDTVRWLRPELKRVDVVSLSTFTQHVLDVMTAHVVESVKRGGK